MGEEKLTRKWSGGLVDWTQGETAYISVVFSWQLDKAYSKAVWYKTQGYDIKVGGPATIFGGGMFREIAEVGGDITDVIRRHNPEATYTSTGCGRNCPFCVVRGDLVELTDWPVRPIVCDNNLLSCSNTHFDSVVDKLAPLKDIDFNQGLDARLLTKRHAEKLRGLKTKVLRLAWDNIAMENKFLSAWQKLIDAGVPPSHIQSYVLIGFDDTPEDALYRLQTIKDLGGLPNPMRYQPLDTKTRDSFVHANWTERELKDFMRYWARQRYLGHITFQEYVNSDAPPKTDDLQISF